MALSKLAAICHDNFRVNSIFVLIILGFESNSGVVYQRDDSAPATTWELMNDAELVIRHKSPAAWFTDPDQFTAAGIANYYVRDADMYDYTVTGLNDYYRAILIYGRPGLAGWPSLALRRGQVSMTVTIRKANEAKQTSQHEVA